MRHSPDPTWEDHLDGFWIVGDAMLVEFHVCVCTPVNPKLGGIVQSVTPFMPVDSTWCLYCFHFQITLSIQRLFISWTGGVIPYQGFIQWEASPGFPPRILGVENILEAFIFSLTLCSYHN